jgi:hypothetical protein
MPDLSVQNSRPTASKLENRAPRSAAADSCPARKALGSACAARGLSLCASYQAWLFITITMDGKSSVDRPALTTWPYENA